MNKKQSFLDESFIFAILKLSIHCIDLWSQNADIQSLCTFSESNVHFEWSSHCDKCRNCRFFNITCWIYVLPDDLTTSSRYISNTAKKKLRAKFYSGTNIFLERNYLYEKKKRHFNHENQITIFYKNWNCANWIEDKYAPEELMEKRLLKY